MTDRPGTRIEPRPRRSVRDGRARLARVRALGGRAVGCRNRAIRAKIKADPERFAEQLLESRNAVGSRACSSTWTARAAALSAGVVAPDVLCVMHEAGAVGPRLVAAGPTNPTTLTPRPTAPAWGWRGSFAGTGAVGSVSVPPTSRAIHDEKRSLETVSLIPESRLPGAAAP